MGGQEQGQHNFVTDIAEPSQASKNILFFFYLFFFFCTKKRGSSGMERDTYNLLSILDLPFRATTVSTFIRFINHRATLATFSFHLDFPRRENRGSNW